MHVILVEPNPEIAQSLVSTLARAKIECDHLPESLLEQSLTNGERSFMASQGMLVGSIEDKETFVRLARKHGFAGPIICLLDWKSTENTIRMLSAGSDDVLIKPVNAHEILARLQAVVRRGLGQPAAEVRIGRITAYFDGRDPEVDGKRLRLSHREHSIFSQLALQVGRVVTKEAIFEAVYGMLDSQPYDKVIDVYICKIRKKIAAAAGADEYIETVYGRGYKLDAPLSDEAPEALAASA